MRTPGIDVVVPSFRRPASLRRCLAGLAAQTPRPTRVLVVARADDTPTRDAARASAVDHGDALPLELVTVADPGLVAALRAGVAASRAPRVAFTDDDAIPRAGWLAGLGRVLDEPGVGVAGGRDFQPRELGPARRTVGVLTPLGRYVGDHHLGVGPPRDVHVVKGVNMAYRQEALAVPRAGVLEGSGAEIHSEELMCSWARARGWRVRFDPAVAVDHRVDADEALAGGSDPRRERASLQASAHNRMLGTIATDPERAPLHVAYGLLVGTREAPGLTRTAVALLRGERDIAQRIAPSLAGQWAGARDSRALHTAMIPASELRRGC